MLRVLDVVRKGADYLASKGVETPRLDAEWLAASALGLDRMQLYLQTDRPLAEGELEAIRAGFRRRARREPLQHILGEWPFDGLSLKVDRRALVPRPETEQLVERIAEEAAGNPPVRILDLGTGGGALALALARRFPEAEVTGLDTSAEALDLAEENAVRNGLADRVRWIRSDWFAGLGQTAGFNLVVANPPYLTEEEWATAEPEVKDHDPRVALVAADDGCAELLRILQEAPARLAPGGRLYLETGIAQGERLRAEARSGEAWKTFRVLEDWSGRPRFFAAERK
ncbi:MAG: peptide chain release factor N(5)-glutamine methyltransferase [Puniceicoccaceae bacterium]|nr:MAG: peptide chain release factor N(5)-glutamine methyltransferase [Puniceicoccaceae bacterium]